jgi:iron complex transport system ATP-binding protein
MTNNTGDNILKIDSLKIGYASGRNAGVILPPLYASARKGELVAVLGRNGIGKSTLLRTIAGVQPSLGGTVLINGENTAVFSGIQLAQRIGYISTEVVKVSHMRVYDLVALGRFPYTNWIGRIDNAAHAIIKEAIIKTGLAHFESRFISELSDGERQRAMIARVMAQDADILIMDEPTAFLDITGKYEIINLMRDLAAAGKAIIFSTHDFSIAINQADKIWLVQENSLIEGSPEDLLLANTFDHLFDQKVVGFNPDDGSFVFHTEPCGKIFIEGVGILRQWTIKALARKGINVADVKTIPYIQLPSGNGEWTLVTGDSAQSFKSIYDLISRLWREKSRIT